MHADEPTSSAPTEAPPEGSTLADLVRERLERDGLRPEAAADTIGIPTPRLIGLLQGRPPNFSTQRKIEAWLSGKPEGGSEPEELTPSSETAIPAAEPSASGEVSEPAAVESSPAASEPAAGEAPAPAPRRRGRPPKVRPAEEAAAAPAAPKRRGRPPKNPAATATGAEPIMPKRRGRPPKNRDQAEASAPKRRGRPPKHPQAEAAAPKRRGRPPKHPAAVAEPPKRRGRPPKNPAATPTAAAAPLELMPKRRGRPPKNRSPIGMALRELMSLADDALALAVHRADPARRKRIEAALR